MCPRATVYADRSMVLIIHQDGLKHLLVMPKSKSSKETWVNLLRSRNLKARTLSKIAKYMEIN